MFIRKLVGGILLVFIASIVFIGAKFIIHERALYKDTRVFQSSIKHPIAGEIDLSKKCVSYTQRDNYEIYGIDRMMENLHSGYMIDGIRAGNANVTVNRPGKEVMLFLTSPSQTLWNIYVYPGTKLAGVYVSSARGQMVRGTPKDAFVEINTCHKGGPKFDLKEEILKMGHKPENIFLTPYTVESSLDVGDRKKLREYNFEKENVIGIGTERTFKADLEGLYALMHNGMLYPLYHTKPLNIKDARIVRQIPNENFIRNMEGKPVFTCLDPDECGLFTSFVMREQIDTLPAFKEIMRPYLYIPADLKVPENINPSWQIFIIDKTRLELNMPLHD
ncbi:MAG: hypothetical protein LBU87_02985 [Lactobacillales bacterium]|jgi:hypothetical protein|nr:hypothetical protein [Lactobacillales bacterium]